MARREVPLLLLNQGEVSKLALARVDLKKPGAECQLNWMAWLTGAMSLRPGLEYIGETADSEASSLDDTAPLLIPFVYSKLDTAELELTDNLMRVRVDEALLTRAAVSTTVTNGDFSSATGWTLTASDGCTADISSTVGGALFLQAVARGGVVSCLRSVAIAGGDQAKLHALRIVVLQGEVTFMCGSTSGGDELIARTVLGKGTHSLTFTPGVATAYVKFESKLQRAAIVDQIQVEGSGTFTLPTSWSGDDLDAIRTEQSGDVIFVACAGQQPKRIERRDNGSWSIVDYVTENGPCTQAPPAGITLTPSVYEGNGTLTASLPYFRSGHVGKLFRIFTPGQTKAALLCAAGAVTDAIRIAGVGVGDRGFNWVVSGTFVGTLSLQRSVEGPTTGFKEVDTKTAGGTYAVDDTATYNNTVVWYRVEFKIYTSGSATVSFTGTTVTTPAASGSGLRFVTATSTAASQSGTTGICRVTAYTSATQVSIEVLSPFSSVAAASDWLGGDWSTEDGWPSSLAFHQGRLWWFGGIGWWGSQSDNYLGYASEDIFGNPLGDAGAIIGRFGSGPSDTVSFGLSLLRLLIGREETIESARSSAFDTPMTPTDFSVKACSTDGADRLPALRFDQRGLYVQQSHRRVFELAYLAQAGDYVARDVTRLNLDIGKARFTSLAAQRQPDPTAHFVRGDGQSAMLLTSPAEDVEAWLRMQTLGIIERVCVRPSDAIEDRVSFVIRRTVNGTAKRFIERLALRDDCVGGLQNHQLDSFKTYSGAAASSITLAHLPNTEVAIWADGAALGTVTTSGAGVATLPGGASATEIVAGLAGRVVTATTSSPGNTLAVGTAYNGYPAEVYADIGATGVLKRVGPVTVAGGDVALPHGRTATTIVAFLGYVAPYRSGRLAPLALSSRKKLDHVGLILADTHYQGLQYGQDFAHLDDLPLIEQGAETAADTVWPDFDAPPVELNGSWDTDSRLCLLAQAPYPATVMAIAALQDEK